ncbi:trans-sulfuration enzyme family protein [Paenibacillus eucommiae]|uniref:Cystathionine beta-lyase/cystathionine gamma-synthase n=1 Tax=Paenibacillus eucommiae TaxID=1355755 RepID=A0ABS4IT60_9BACL|nr:PLP-dependent aspartate aminotransferase family protein [Paenibacillus eucommiae]MBP1990740.1 cystathionine beta-lyase/cystathionine gamma-synthase [Paenibacillus eucommiae]
MNKQTYVVHDHHDERHQGAVTFPIYQNSLFTFANYDDFDAASDHFFDHFVYSRGNNPTVRELEKRLAGLEGGEEARCFASGMAAISAAVMSVVKQGDHIVCVDQAYGPAQAMMGSYLQKFGVTCSFVDGTSIDAIAAAILPNTTLLYLESPTSLFFSLQDLEACVQLAKKSGAATIIDNTWATPCFQNPLRFGVDLVVHSISKYIGGHSDVTGGAVIGSHERLERLNQNEFMLIGGLMTPHTATLVTRGMRTLPLRLEQQQKYGLQIADFLQTLPYVRKVHHPGLTSHPQHELAVRQMEGFSSLLSFETDIPLQDMRKWTGLLKYFRIGVSWGGYESLVTIFPLPLGAGVNSNSASAPCTILVRLYIGLEHPDDLIRDIRSAFEQIGLSEGD